MLKNGTVLPGVSIKKLLITALFLLSFALFSALLLRPLQKRTLSAIKNISDGLLSRAEILLGKDISYTGTGLAFPALLDIRGISLSGGKAPDISIERLRVRYSIAALLEALWTAEAEGGNSATAENILSALGEIIVDRPQIIITLDSAKPTDSADSEESVEGFQLSRLQDAIKEALRFLPANVNFILRRGTVELRYKNGGVLFNNIKAGARFSGGNLKITSSANAKGEIAYAEAVRLNGGKPLDFDTPLKLSAGFSREDGRVLVTARLPKIKTPLADINALGLEALLDGETIVLRKTGGNLPWAFSAALDIETGAASAVFKAENFSPGSLFLLKGAAREYAKWVPESISGEAAANAPSITKGSLEGAQFFCGLRGRFRAASPVGGASFAVRGSGDMNSARAGEVSLVMSDKNKFPQGSLSFSGNIVYKTLAVDGTFRVKDFTLQEDRPLNGDFRIDTIGSTTSVFAESLLLGGIELQAFNVNISRENNVAVFDLSALRFREININEETGYGDIRLGRITSELFYNWKEKNLDATAALEEISAEDLLNITKSFIALPVLPDIAEDIIERTQFTTDVFFTTDFKSITYNIPTLVTVYTGKEKNGKPNNITAVSSINGTEDHFTLSEASINLPGGTLLVLGDFDFSDIDDIYFRTEWTYNDLFYYFNGQALDRSSVTITGSYNLRAFFSLSDEGSISGYVRTDQAQVPFNDKIVSLNLAVSLRYDSIYLWYADLELFQIQNILIGTSPINLFSLTGRINQNGANFSNISITDSNGVLSGSAAADWDIEFNEIIFNAGFTGRTSSESFYANGNYRGGVLSAQITSSNVKLSRFIKNNAASSISGIFDFTYNRWTQEENNKWALSLDLSSFSGNLGGTDFNIAGKGNVRPGSFSLSGVRINYGALTADIPLISLLGGQLNADCELRGAFLGRAIMMNVSGSADFPNFTNFLQLSEGLSIFKGELNVSTLRLDEWMLEEPVDFTFSRQDSVVSVHGGRSGMIRLEIENTGDFYGSLGFPSPVRGVVAGWVRGGNISLRGSNLYIDLRSLWDYLPQQDVINIKGGFAMADIEVRGPLADPEFYGQVLAQSVRLEVPRYLDAEIGPIPITITLQEQRMRFGPVRAPCGSGLGTVSGVFDFNRWIPNNFTITIRVDEPSPIPYRVAIAGINAHGNTSGFLEIALWDDVFSVTGSLLGDNTEITMNPENFSTGSAGASSSQVIIDLTITTGRRVEFLWPNERLPILRANPVMGNSFHIASDSFAGNFELKGEVDIRSGEIFYIERSFYIREGTLTFDENETRFQPMIEARAEVRDRNEDGPVTISLIIDNQPLMSFQARFESSPALSQSEIFALLGQSIVGGQTDESGQITGAFAGAASDVLSQFYVVRTAERWIRDILGLDMFSVRTQALTNAVLQVFGTSTVSENSPAASSSNLSRYLDNTTIFAGKYINSDVFIQGMLSLRIDEENYAEGRQGLRIEPDIGFELHNPLFDIHWNIVPTHPESLFLQDTSFTFLWRRSF